KTMRPRWIYSQRLQNNFKKSVIMAIVGAARPLAGVKQKRRHQDPTSGMHHKRAKLSTRFRPHHIHQTGLSFPRLFDLLPGDSRFRPKPLLKNFITPAIMRSDSLNVFEQSDDGKFSHI
ncbi:MAG: hypothetical protein QGG84_05035, partial [Rhodospirillales bacterium]|nr:hypothetical protein [Rhodospirillales bacterium]